MTWHVKVAILTTGVGLAILGGMMWLTSPSETVHGRSSVREFKVRLVEKARFHYDGSTIQAWQEVDDKLMILE